MGKLWHRIKLSNRARRWLGLVLISTVCGAVLVVLKAAPSIPLPRALQVAFASLVLAIGIHEVATDPGHGRNTFAPSPISTYIIKTLLIAAGIMLLVWGLSILTWQPKIKHVPTYSDEEGVGFCGNILNPTAWELIQKIVTGPIGCSFAAIIAAFVGFMLALACTLSALSLGRTNFSNSEKQSRARDLNHR